MAAASIAYTLAAIISIVVLARGDLVSCLCGDSGCAANLVERGIIFGDGHTDLVCEHPVFYRIMLYLSMAFALAAAAVNVAVMRGTATLLSMPRWIDGGIILLEAEPDFVLEAAWAMPRESGASQVCTREVVVEAAARGAGSPMPPMAAARAAA